MGISTYLKIFKALMIYLISAGFIFNVTGCATVGQEFAATRVMEIKLAETTQQEVKQMFGEPWRTCIEDGLVTWTYADYKYYLFAPEDTQDLVIRFDNMQRVKSYTFNTTRQ